jgi:hypothetical protein
LTGRRGSKDGGKGHYAKKKITHKAPMKRRDDAGRYQSSENPEPLQKGLVISSSERHTWKVT